MHVPNNQTTNHQNHMDMMDVLLLIQDKMNVLLVHLANVYKKKTKNQKKILNVRPKKCTANFIFNIPKKIRPKFQKMHVQCTSKKNEINFLKFFVRSKMQFFLRKCTSNTRITYHTKSDFLKTYVPK